MMISMINCDNNHLKAKYLCRCVPSHEPHLNLNNLLSHIPGNFAYGRIYRSSEVNEQGLPTSPPNDCRLFETVSNLVSVIFTRMHHRKEKRVDTSLVADIVTLVSGEQNCLSDCAGTNCVCKITSHVLATTHRIIVASGDADMEPAVTKALSRGYHVNVLALKNTCSQIYSSGKFKNNPRFELQNFT